MKIGEHWAYRARPSSALLEVIVRSLPASRPSHAKIEYADDEFAGRGLWVSRTTLPGLWADQAEIDAAARAWKLLRSQQRPTAEEVTAARTVLLVVDPEDEIVQLSGWGIADLPSVTRAAALAALTVDELIAHPATIVSGESAQVPWLTVEALCRGTAARRSAAILGKVRAGEARDRRWFLERVESALQYGTAYARDFQAELELSIGTSAATTRGIIREWCGAGAVEAFEKDQDAQSNLEALTLLALQAIPELRTLRTKRAARVAEAIASAIGLSSAEHGGYNPAFTPQIQRNPEETDEHA